MTRHAGITKGYAPVPKFEPSLHDNETILRQVEAAIAPLRSSTASPDRSSSPESDMMLMADRDVMTLPLRKRKLYMSDNVDMAEAEHSKAGAKDLNPKVMRHSSVIQFAKAS
ncbi:hypothetical protein DOY81_013123 [Sarcophaga bullata]|nr:hypothetical protein DOY81_013123 [Sarcophaga bullata]